MINFTTSPITIGLGTDFVIAIDSITDANGDAVDLATFQFSYEFYVGTPCRTYRVSNDVHSLYQNNILYFVFEKYPFVTGQMYYIEKFDITSDLFPDNSQTIKNTYLSPITFV